MTAAPGYYVADEWDGRRLIAGPYTTATQAQAVLDDIEMLSLGLVGGRLPAGPSEIVGQPSVVRVNRPGGGR